MVSDVRDLVVKAAQLLLQDFSPGIRDIEIGRCRFTLDRAG
jgi:hypothetical protein